MQKQFFFLTVLCATQVAHAMDRTGKHVTWTRALISALLISQAGLAAATNGCNVPPLVATALTLSKNNFVKLQDANTHLNGTDATIVALRDRTYTQVMTLHGCQRVYVEPACDHVIADVFRLMGPVEIALNRDFPLT